MSPAIPHATPAGGAEGALPERMAPGLRVFCAPDWDDYQLLDSGGGEKLERFGPYVLRRPDPQALWRPRLPVARWERADLSFERESDRGGRWRAASSAPAALRTSEPAWTVQWGAARFSVRPTPFKHVGLFPEQQGNWRLIERLCRSLPDVSGLNLFGYSGAASVIAGLCGAQVRHVDASRAALKWTLDNAALSGVPAGRIAPLLEDALEFCQRAVRRGERYRFILLDPPHYGRGPKGQKWQLEEGLAPLLEAAERLLDERGLLILSTYAVGYSPLAFQNLLSGWPAGQVAVGELALREGDGTRLLPCGFCARYARGLDFDLNEPELAARGPALASRSPGNSRAPQSGEPT
jgi:23S rRNA (cytosine1962-C5)-methyltransferase